MSYADYNPDDEDQSFASRYPESVPPDAQTAIDAGSAARVNAAGRIAATPAIGSPGANPETDATNRQLASAMDRADIGNRFGFGSPEYQESGATGPSLNDARASDIASRRQEIGGQINEIKAKLGVIPPSAAGFSAVVLPNGPERQQLLQNWHLLENESQNLLQEHHDTATEAARTAHETFARESHITAAKDFSDLSNNLLQIRQNPNLKPGTPEYGTAILQAAKDHPNGFQTEAGQMLVRGMSEGHDKASTLETATQDKEYLDKKHLVEEYAKTRGVDPVYDEQGMPSFDKTRDYADQFGPQKTSTEKIPASAYTELGKLNAQKASDALYLAREVDPKKKDNLQKKIDATEAAIGAWHTTYGDTSGTTVQPSSEPTVTPPPAGAPAATLERPTPKPISQWIQDAGRNYTDSTAPRDSPEFNRLQELAVIEDSFNRNLPIPKESWQKAGITAPQDQAAIKWAYENPTDPRSVQIRKLHGL